MGRFETPQTESHHPIWSLQSAARRLRGVLARRQRGASRNAGGAAEGLNAAQPGCAPAYPCFRSLALPFPTCRPSRAQRRSAPGPRWGVRRDTRSAGRCSGKRRARPAVIRCYKIEQRRDDGIEVGVGVHLPSPSRWFPKIPARWLTRRSGWLGLLLESVLYRTCALKHK